MALLQKETCICNLRHPMHLCRPVAMFGWEGNFDGSCVTKSGFLHERKKERVHMCILSLYVYVYMYKHHNVDTCICQGIRGICIYIHIYRIVCRDSFFLVGIWSNAQRKLIRTCTHPHMHRHTHIWTSMHAHTHTRASPLSCSLTLSHSRALRALALFLTHTHTHTHIHTRVQTHTHMDIHSIETYAFYRRSDK